MPLPSDSPIDSSPLWLEHARAFERMMVKEQPGHAVHPLIRAFFQYTQLAGSVAGDSDETPWCSAFACACMELAGIESPRHALAWSWLNWGVEIPDFRRGCILVYKDLNHVGFYRGVHEAGQTIETIGGNQSNKVCTTFYPKERLISKRWIK